MELTGGGLIGSSVSAGGTDAFHARDASTGETLGPAFVEATQEEIDRAVRAAARAFHSFRRIDRAPILRAIADGIEALGPELIVRCRRETGLPEDRLVMERERTVRQIRMFADLVAEGSWVGARIDRGDPDRRPAPKPDVRRMLVAIGPVAVFGAGNFPFAFSVAGGDTAAALAAGCPVVAKGHPAHPGTSEMVARVILDAAPDGAFSMVQGRRPETSLELVRQPEIRAVAFTGSLRAGRALMDAAAARPDPIPVFAEMGSANPVFLLPGALEKDAQAVAQGLHRSATLGAGQFCTKPGLVFLIDHPEFVEKLAALFRETPPAPMLHDGILRSYVEGVRHRGTAVRRIAASPGNPPAVLFETDLETFRADPGLAEELFGPSTLLVKVRRMEELESAARGLRGQLTATVHGAAGDRETFAALAEILEQKAGRVIYNGFPTGVEVCASMHHGGPYPAASDPRTTSVGAAGIDRFARPVCYQGFPADALPEELQDSNPRGIRRLVDGRFTEEPL